MTLLTLEKRGHVGILTLNRPEMMNALGAPGDGDVVADVCAEVNADREIRCVILTGAGRAFSAGGDVKAMKERTGAFGGNGVSIRDGYRGNIHKVVKAIYYLEVPSIAAVNGAAIGLGCDVACMTDIRISSDQAKYGVTFLKLGIIPGDGGALFLTRIVGAQRAAELTLTGRIVKADEAKALGLLLEVTEPDALLPRAKEIASKIASKPPQAIRYAKRLLKLAQRQALEEHLDACSAFQAICHKTEDHQEALKAFFEKRPGKFTGA